MYKRTSHFDHFGSSVVSKQSVVNDPMNIQNLIFTKLIVIAGLVLDYQKQITVNKILIGTPALDSGHSTSRNVSKLVCMVICCQN